MPHARSNADAYLAAGESVLDHADRIIAVWDGQLGGHGGSADVVEAARQRGVPVTVGWSGGGQRD